MIGKTCSRMVNSIFFILAVFINAMITIFCKIFLSFTFCVAKFCTRSKKTKASSVFFARLSLSFAYGRYTSALALKNNQTSLLFLARLFVIRLWQIYDCARFEK